MKKYLTYIVLGLILVFGATFRFSGIIKRASAFTYDQGRDFLVVYDLVVNHKITLLGPTTGIPGIFYGPWWYWFLAIPFIISGGDPAAGVFFVALVGLLAIIVGFLLGKKMAGDFGGFIAAGFISFSPFFISTSSQMWHPNLVPLLTLSSLLIFLKILEKSRWHLFFLLGLLAGFIFQMEASFGIFYFLGSLIYIIYKFRGKIVTFLVGFFLVLLPQLIFDLRHEFLITKGILDAILHPKIFQVKLSFFERITNRLELFLGVFSKTFTLEDKIIGLILLLLLVLGFLLCLKRVKEKREAFPFLILITTIFVGFSIYPDVVWDYYLVGLPPLFLFFLLLILSQKPSFLKTGILVLTLILVFANLGDNLKKKEKWVGDSSVLRNQLEVLDFIYQDAKKEKFNVTTYTPPLLDYSYRYLFLWYGQKEYGYQPSEPKEPKKILYLILEPDVYMPGRRELWLKERQGDGKTVFRQKFESGLEVEKRIR